MKWINRSSSLILLVGGAAYCVGFVVVNSHLSQYGIVPYDFVQPRYVSAGALYLLATVVVATSLWYIIDVFIPHYWASDEYKGEKTAAFAVLVFFLALQNAISFVLPKKDANSTLESISLFAPVAVSFALPYIDTFLEKRFPLPQIRGWWRERLLKTGALKWVVMPLMLTYVSLAVGTLTFSFFPLFLFGTVMALPFTRSKGTVSVSDYINGPVYGLIAVVGSMYLFGTRTYTLISPHVGGGKPALIVIALKHDNRVLIGKVMGREDSKCLMQNISVIHESNEAIYILPHGYYSEENAIVIPKSEIATYAYQKSQLPDNAKCID